MVSLLFSKCLHSKGSFTRSDGNGNDIVASVHTGEGGRKRQHPNTYTGRERLIRTRLIRSST